MGLTFTSVEFILFLGICLGLIHAVGRLPVRICLVIIFSYFFCLTFGFAGALVVTFTAIVNFFVGNQLGASVNDAVRKRWLWAGLTANLVPLVFLKYSGFLLGILATLFRPLGAHFSAPSSLMFPVIGLSYFTFSGMSYVLDIYWEKMEPSRNFSEFLFSRVFPETGRRTDRKGFRFSAPAWSGLQNHSPRLRNRVWIPSRRGSQEAGDC
jgi:alginate O-acetyltransferase complex protein AlgI